MTVSAEARHSGMAVTKGTWKDVKLVLAKCGVGKVNAAICTPMLSDLYKPEAIAFSGVAGDWCGTWQSATW